MHERASTFTHGPTGPDRKRFTPHVLPTRHCSHLRRPSDRSSMSNDRTLLSASTLNALNRTIALSLAGCHCSGCDLAALLAIDIYDSAMADADNYLDPGFTDAAASRLDHPARGLISVDTFNRRHHLSAVDFPATD